MHVNNYRTFDTFYSPVSACLLPFLKMYIVTSKFSNILTSNYSLTFIEIFSSIYSYVLYSVLMLFIGTFLLFFIEQFYQRFVNFISLSKEPTFCFFDSYYHWFLLLLNRILSSTWRWEEFFCCFSNLNWMLTPSILSLSFFLSFSYNHLWL